MEVDSLVLVHLVKSGRMGKWPLVNVVRKIHWLLHKISSSFGHIYHEVNTVADCLAGRSAQGSRVFEANHILPREVQGCLSLDTRE